MNRLDEFFAKIDAFFEAGKARYGEAITCRAGCDDCCRRRFSVTSIEAAAIRAALARLPEETRASLRERAADTKSASCPALEPDGTCAVYEARPTICRTHGLPIRFKQTGKDGRSLPILDACPKNFSGQDLEALDPKGILDQTTLSTLLGALDAAFSDAEGRPRGERFEMTELLA